MNFGTHSTEQRCRRQPCIVRYCFTIISKNEDRGNTANEKKNDTTAIEFDAAVYPIADERICGRHGK